jgi:hypothetical protein
MNMTEQLQAKIETLRQRGCDVLITPSGKFRIDGPFDGETQESEFMLYGDEKEVDTALHLTARK